MKNTFESEEKNRKKIINKNNGSNKKINNKENKKSNRDLKN